MDKSQVHDPATFYSRARKIFDGQQVLATLGASLQPLRSGEVEIMLPYSRALTQHHGFLHAGVVATMLDTACGIAAFSVIPSGADVLTIEFKANLLSPAVGESFSFRGRVVKAGRRIVVAQAHAFAIAGGAPKEIAMMVATLFVAPEGQIPPAVKASDSELRPDN